MLAYPADYVASSFPLSIDAHCGDRHSGEAFKNICKAYGEEAVSGRIVRRRFSRQSKGNEDLENQRHTGQSKEPTPPPLSGMETIEPEDGSSLVEPALLLPSVVATLPKDEGDVSEQKSCKKG
uniref:Mos1 transposase HTH domain-containing protein n=1 Tax=Romanomermis culicivorax TaxID=13658 RepID=A0A915JSU0_ROMCU